MKRPSTPVSPQPVRRGFSLVELLVVVAIIAVLIGMLLPAIQSARESARRSSCQGKLKQVAMAVLMYEQSQGRLPMAADVKTPPTACGDCYNPWHEAGLSSTTAANEQGTSWMLGILPFIDETTVANQWNRQTNVRGNAALAQTDIASFYCPSRRAGIRQDNDDQRNLLDAGWLGGGTDYGGCHGRFDGFDPLVATERPFLQQADAAGSTGQRRGVFVPKAAVATAAIRDGLSNTLLIGELQRLRPIPGGAAVVETDHRQSQDGWAVGGVATLFVTSVSPAGHAGGINNGFFQSPGSEHRGGAFFAMADGSVHWIGEEIDAGSNQSVFALLGSMSDGQIASLAANQ
ncbi:MAG: DUF1559 domain-containing protein [Planctomycetia bacterium]|nr:DUF1559 domain-containing protein [Planctomycetia bacterium]